MFVCECVCCFPHSTLHIMRMFTNWWNKIKCWDAIFILFSSLFFLFHSVTWTFGSFKTGGKKKETERILISVNCKQNELIFVMKLHNIRHPFSILLLYAMHSPVIEECSILILFSYYEWEKRERKKRRELIAYLDPFIWYNCGVECSLCERFRGTKMDI